jgi:hypothetical protein
MGQRSRASPRTTGLASSATALFFPCHPPIASTRLGLETTFIFPARAATDLGRLLRKVWLRVGADVSARVPLRQKPLPSVPVHCSKNVADSGCQIRSKSPKDRDTRTRDARQI